MNFRNSQKENYFNHDADIGIIGHGESLETCFADTAQVMFTLMCDIENVHPLQIITFEFEEADTGLALVKWLNMLITKAKEHHLIFCDFRLKHDGISWRATVSGEPWRKSLELGIEVKEARATNLSVKKTDHIWEARCLVDV